MRLWPIVLLTFLLAGCTLPEEEEVEPLLGVCPQWLDSEWTGTAGAALNASRPGHTMVLVPLHNGTPVLSQDGQPLDRYTLRFTNLRISGGTVEVRAFLDSTEAQRGILDHRDDDGTMSKPFLTFGPATNVTGVEFEVFLSSIEHGSTPQSDALRLTATFKPFVQEDGHASFGVLAKAGYRVCGAIV